MATNLATAYVQIQASTQGVGSDISRALGQAGNAGGAAGGKQATRGFTKNFAIGGAVAGVAGVVAAKLGGVFGGFISEAVQASDATNKFVSTMSFAGLDTGPIEKAKKAAQAYADQTVYDLPTIQNMMAQLASNGVKDYTGLSKAAGNLNAVAGGNAETFKSVAMTMTQTAGAGKLTTENWNQLSDAIPGAAGPLMKALEKAKAYSGNFRDEMSKGAITADEFNAALLELGTKPVAVEAAKSTKTFEGAIGNLQATLVGGLTSALNAAKPAITGAINVVNTGISGLFSGIGTLAGKVGEVLGPVAAQMTAAMAPMLAQLGSAIGPLLTQIGTALGPAFAQISAAITPLIPQIVAFATSFSPIGIIVQALLPVLPQIAAMLGTLGVAFGQIVAAVLPLATTLMTAIVPVFMQLVSTILPIVIQLVTTLVSAFAPLVAQLVTALAPILAQLATSVLPMLGQAFAAILGAIMPVVNVILAILIPALQFLMPIVIGIVQGIVNNVIGAIQGIVSVITGVISLITALFTGNWAAAWAALKQIVFGAVQAVWNLIQLYFVGKMVKGIMAVMKSITALFTSGWNAVKTTVQGSLGSVKATVQTGMNLVRTIVQTVLSAVRSVFTSTFNAVKSVVSGGMSAVQSTVQGALNAVRSAFSSAFATVKSIVTGGMSAVKSAVQSGINAVVSFFKGLVGKITGALGGLPGKLGTIGRQMIEGMINGIKAMAANVVDSIVGVAQGAIDGAKRFLGIHSPSRVFRDEVGKQISRGLAAGVTADQGKAVKAVEDLSKAVAKAGEKAIKQETANAKADRTKANTQIAKHNKALAAKRDAAVAKADKIKNSKQRAAAKKAAQSAFKAAKKDRLPALSKAEAEKVAKRNIRAIQSAQGKAQRILDAQGQTTGGIWEFGNTKGVQRIVNSLSDSGKWTRNASRQTRSSTLADLAKGREVMADRIESANKRLDEMVDYRNQNAERIMGELDLKPTEGKDGKKKKLSIAEVSSRVKSLAAKAKQFASKLAALGKAGLPPGLISEIAGYGTTEGIQVANAILSGTKKQQSTLGKDWKGLESASNRFGSVATEQFFGVGVAAQQGIIKGLQSDDQKLKKAAENLASKLTKATRKALGIHSPSRVFRDQVGAYIPAGVIAGIDQGQSKLDHRVAGMVGTQAPNIAQIAPAEFTAGGYGADQPIIIQGPLVEVKEMRVDSERRVKQVAQDLHTRATRAARSRGAVQLAGVVR